MTAVDPVPTRPFVLRFAIAYVLALVAVAIIAQVLSLGGGGSGAGAAALVVAAAFAMGKFVKTARRGPSSRERNALLWGSWAFTMALQLVLGLLLIGRVPLGPMLLAGLVVGVVYWLGLRLMYSGWMASRMLRGFRKRKTRRRSR